MFGGTLEVIPRRLTRFRNRSEASPSLRVSAVRLGPFRILMPWLQFHTAAGRSSQSAPRAWSHTAAATQLTRCSLAPSCWCSSLRGAVGFLAGPCARALHRSSASRSHQQLCCSSLAGWGGWDSFVGSETADLRCCEGVLAEGPSSNASQSHAELAISGFSNVNPMDLVTTPTPRCLRQSPRSHCSCSAS